jgi:hypothetical protein
VALLGLVGLSVLAFGWEAWPRFLDSLLGHAGAIDPWVSDARKATVAASLVLAGVPRGVATAVQWGLAAGLAVGVALAFRGGVSPWRVGLLIAAGFAATPYGFHYDLPLLVAAVLMLARGEDGAARRLGWPEAAVLAAALVFPAVVTLSYRLVWVTGPCLLALVGLAAWKSFSRAGGICARRP